MSTLITLITLYRAVSVLSLLLPSLCLPCLSFEISCHFVWEFAYFYVRGGDLPAWFQFQGLHFYVHLVFDQCVVSSFEFHVASIQSSTKRESAFSMLFALVCCDSCFDFSDVCTFISVPRGTPRAFINMASLYIYLCGDGATRVLFIYGVVCV